MTAPTGCSLVSYTATCDFATWSPALLDTDFSKSPSRITVQSVNGVIPSNAFSGLHNADSYTGSGNPMLSLNCGFVNAYTLTLLSDSFSSNLNWVQEMSISDCYNMNINAGALSYMTGVTILTFLAGNFTSLDSTALTGMTSLETLYLYASMPSSGVPAGLFSGLTALTTLDMSRTPLYSLPSGLFADQKNLTTLTIEETSLTTLPADLFWPLLSINSLTLDFNTWTCDCNLYWLEQYLTSTGVTTTTCGTPTAYAGYDLQRVIQSLGCVTTTSTSTSSDDWRPWVYGLIGGATLALTIAIIACICCCRNRHKLRQLKDKSRDPEHKKSANQKADKSANQKAEKPANQKSEISNSSNWVAKTGYVSIEKKKSMVPVEETPRRVPETKPASQPPPYVAGNQRKPVEESSLTPRMFRASRVTPSDVNPNVYNYRAQMMDSW